MTHAVPDLATGFMVLHGNRMEDLRAVVVEWLRAQPLAPLEDEAVLVQSNGMAQWLKLALAGRDGNGICAAVEVQLPGRFLWRAYRAVLGEPVVLEHSPYDKEPLAWRLMRVLPGVLGAPAMAPLRRYLAEDDSLRKRFQLAQRLADLFDQYQVYRADWLVDWEAGRDRLGTMPLPEEQRWQAQLWRALVADVGSGAQDQSRPAVHQRFLETLEAATERPAGLPRRILVFGLSSLPRQFLEALRALSKFCQVILAVHNPCRHYWADIIEGKELLRAQRRRQAAKPGLPAPEDTDLHLHGNPLLAAWGKQGRDYIRLLDEFDEPEAYRGWFNGGRVDVFTEPGAGQGTLLQQVQQAILDLEPLPASARLLDPMDGSLRFQTAHSALREVEILHDELLALFDAPAQEARRRAGEPALTPREVIVMVPDIQAYAPHIEAVFGQYAQQPDEPRYLPYAITDATARGHDPLLVAVEQLLALRDSRFALGDILDLLEVPALRRRFGLAEAELPLLQRWLEGAGVRWGLDAGQRASLGLPDGLEQNSWRFGLRRMLLGYAAGAGAPWQNIEPYDEVAGLEAAALGPLTELLAALEALWLGLAAARNVAAWAGFLRALLADFFEADSPADTLSLHQLGEALNTWQEQAGAAGFDEALPVAVVGEAWLGGLSEAPSSRRFLAGAVNFCTLMPMRAIPFRVVALLGMNDGDYPRRHTAPDFDLMAGPGQARPGDRSRREDDRYLLLEALLSAREQLTISWIGRSVRDDTEKPPSVLVAQLRDYLAAGWCLAGDQGEPATAGERLLTHLTLTHPLQAFSRRYFAAENVPLFTYAREWRAVHEPGAAVVAAPLEASTEPEALSLSDLARFIRDPVKTWFNRRLGVHFDALDEQTLNEEPFELDALERFGLGRELLDAGLAAPEAEAAAVLVATGERLRREGRLPMCAFAELALAPVRDEVAATLDVYRGLSAGYAPHEPLPLVFAGPEGLRIEDWLSALRVGPDGSLAQFLASPNALRERKSVKWHRLIEPWVAHVLAHTLGLALHTHIAAPEGVLSFAPLGPEAARAIAQGWLGAWRAGLREPLPVACKSQFAWLEQPEGEGGRSAYEGAYQKTGEVEASPYLARTYPDWEALHAAPGFEHWAEVFYGALLRQLSGRESEA